MSRSMGNIGWVQRQDGERDERYRMPQMLNNDGSRDRRFNLYEQPSFGSSELLARGRSQYYERTSTSHLAGVYQLSTSNGYGRPTTQYTGMSNDLERRVNEHARASSDNLQLQMNQAANRGMDVRMRFAPADNPFEARAQELFLLGQRNFNWNTNNNGGANERWWH